MVNILLTLTIATVVSLLLLIMKQVKQYLFIVVRLIDVPQPGVGWICAKVSKVGQAALRPLAALRPSTASDMKAIRM